MIRAFLADSSSAVPWTQSFMGLAALITAVVGYLVYKDKNKLNQNDSKVNILATSQASMIAALERSDTDNERLRGRVDDLEDEIIKINKGWSEKVASMEDENIKLTRQIAACETTCETLKQQMKDFHHE